MPTHLSIATALDKNLIASNNVYLLLLEVDVINPNDGTVIQTFYLAHNNENFVWNGNTYISTPLEVTTTQDNQTAPTCTITIWDMGRVIQGNLQAYGWQLAWPVRMKIVNATNPAKQPEIEQDFEVLSATCKDDDYSIAFTVGAENPLTLRFPPRQQFPNRCFWKYRDNRCQYTGSLPSCDYTEDGTNGCKAHNNIINYGGFPGLRQDISTGSAGVTGTS